MARVTKRESTNHNRVMDLLHSNKPQCRMIKSLSSITIKVMVSVLRGLSLFPKCWHGILYLMLDVVETA